MPFSSLVESNTSNNNDRLRKALAQRSTPSKPSLPQLATNLTESSLSISESPFDDVFIDPHHVSVTTFSTYASSTSSSSNESTDSMLVSSLASPSNTTCSTSFMTSSASVSPPPAFLAASQDPASKPSPDSLSFLDSSVPPISSTPTQFNIQRMKMVDSNNNYNNHNAQACAVAKSSASTLSNNTVNSTTHLSRQNTHIHTTPPTTYSTQFNKINGANLLGQNHAMEYGKFGKIVAGSVHSFSSFDSTDSFGRRSGSAGPRRLFEKSKGTLVIKEERAPRSFSSNLNLETNSMHFNSPGSCFSRNTSVSNFASAKSSIHTINRPNDELYDAFHHNHQRHNHLYADPINRSANAKSLFSDPRVAGSEDNNSTQHSDFLLPHQSSNMSLNSDVSGLARTNTLLSNTSSLSADPNDPTDLSAAFMNLHTSSTPSAGSSSGKKSRRSSFHVISSSDFAHCAEEEEEEFSDNESVTGAGNHVPKPAFPISPKVFRKPSIRSVHSSTHLDLNLDLDKVIHNALVESAHINTPTNMSCHSAFHHEDYYQYPTHPVSTNHSDNNNNANNITTTTTRRSSLAHDTFSRPLSTNLHYDSEMLQATHTTDEYGSHLHSIHSGTAQEDLPPAEPHPRHTTFGKFGTSVKKFARKMASSHAEH